MQRYRSPFVSAVVCLPLAIATGILAAYVLILLRVPDVVSVGGALAAGLVVLVRALRAEVVVRDGSVVIRNIFRTHTVPLERIVDWTSGGLLLVPQATVLVALIDGARPVKATGTLRVRGQDEVLRSLRRTLRPLPPRVRQAKVRAAADKHRWL